MKFRNVLPVAILSVLVLAFTLAYVESVAHAQALDVNAAIGVGVGLGLNGNLNLNGNENRNVNFNEFKVTLDLGDLQLGSTSYSWSENRSKTFWFNEAEIDDYAYNYATGVNQAVVVSGSGNAVSQASNAIYVTAETIEIGNSLF